MRPPIDQQVVFLHTADLEATTRFYRDLLGLPLVLDQGSCRIFQTNEGAFFGFCQHLDVVGPGRSVVLTLVSDEVDAWHSYLLELGAAIETPPALNPTYNIYHLFLRDPNGYLVEIQKFLDPAWPRSA